MAKYSVRIAPAALTDISDIADFYSELVDEASSQRFIVVAFGAFHTAGQPSKYTQTLVERLKELE